MDKAALYGRDTTGLDFAKPQRSHDDDPPDNCLEFARFGDGVWVLRDSEDHGRQIVLTPGEFAAFAGDIQDGKFGTF